MLYANLLLNVLYHINIGMKIREFYLQNGIFIYKMGISVTKQDFNLQNGNLALQTGLSANNSPYIEKGYNNYKKKLKDKMSYLC